MVLRRYVTRPLAALAVSVDGVVPQFGRVHGTYHSRCAHRRRQIHKSVVKRSLSVVRSFDFTGL